MPLGISTLPNSEPLLHSGEQWLAIWFTGLPVVWWGQERERRGEEVGRDQGPVEKDTPPSHRDRGGGRARGREWRWGCTDAAGGRGVPGRHPYAVSYAQM
jgi:hypothetical protein